VSLRCFLRAVPFPIHTAVWPIREVVTRTFRKSGSSTRVGGRPFLIITSRDETIPDNHLAPTFYTNSSWSTSTGVSAQPPTDIRLCFDDEFVSVIKVCLSLVVCSRIFAYSSKKRFLWGPHDVGCDSFHGVTVLFLASWFSNVGIHMTFYIEPFIPIHFATINTQGKFPGHNKFWYPSRDWLGWRWSSENPFTTGLWQVCYSSGQARGTLLYPTSPLPLGSPEGWSPKKIFYLPQKFFEKTGGNT
jgi:hypothetical protein